MNRQVRAPHGGRIAMRPPSFPGKAGHKWHGQPVPHPGDVPRCIHLWLAAMWVGLDSNRNLRFH